MGRYHEVKAICFDYKFTRGHPFGDVDVYDYFGQVAAEEERCRVRTGQILGVVGG